MSYQKHNFEAGAVLFASQLNDMDNQIEVLSNQESTLSENFKIALLNCFENVAWVNQNGQSYYNELYNALYPDIFWTITNTLSGCTNSNNTTNILKNSSYVATITANQGYTLDGATVNILMGGNDVTNLYYSSGSINIPNVTGDLVITVSAVSDVSSITAVFTQGSAVIYDTDSLDTLKQYLTVTANYSDSTTATVTDYTLNGTLTVGTSTITVSYGGKTDTFTVTVTKYWDFEWDYTQGTPIGKGFAHSSAVVGSMTEEGYRLEGASSGGCNLLTDPTTTADIGVSEITIKFNQIYPSMIGFHFDVKGLWAAIINNNKLGYKITANNPSAWNANDVVQVQNIAINTGVEYTFRLEWNVATGATLWLNGEQMYSINNTLTQANRTRWFIAVPSDCVVIVKSMYVKVVS